MKILDITELWNEAKETADTAVGDTPSACIDWKSIRSRGIDLVSIDGKLYEYGKHGLLDPIFKEQK